MSPLETAEKARERNVGQVRAVDVDEDPQPDVDAAGANIPPHSGEPDDRPARRRRPDRPPKWMRGLLWLFAMVLAFLCGYAIGYVWRKVDRRVWG